MSQALSIAHARGWNLATTLMVCINVFHTGTAIMASCRRPNMTAAGNHYRFSAAALRGLRLYSGRAVVVVEGATLGLFVTE
jgi:hypothetical protein